jgi:undecaprenyl-diphosphatase
LIAALVVAVLLLNRLIGMLAVIWAVCIVLLPRVYLGLHYPSDIVAGAALGAVIMVTAQRLAAPQELAPVLMRLEDEHRGLAHGAFFAFSYLCATMFSDLRELVQLFGEFLAISLV